MKQNNRDSGLDADEGHVAAHERKLAQEEIYDFRLGAYSEATRDAAVTYVRHFKGPPGIERLKYRSNGKFANLNKNDPAHNEEHFKQLDHFVAAFLVKLNEYEANYAPHLIPKADEIATQLFAEQEKERVADAEPHGPVFDKTFAIHAANVAKLHRKTLKANLGEINNAELNTLTKREVAEIVKEIIQPRSVHMYHI